MTDKTEETNEEDVEETEPEQDEEDTGEESARGTDADEAGDTEEEESGEDPQLLKERLRIAEEKADRYKLERDRLKERPSKIEKESETVSSPEELAIIRLEARGFRNSDEQKEILRAAKSMGITPVEAAEDEYVLAKIERMRRTKKAAGAVDRPSNGSGTVKKDVNYYIRKGILPTDRNMLAEVQDELARQARSGR